ncbi:hypothetical protein AAG906_028539 [Vitis piasezkii]
MKKWHDQLISNKEFQERQRVSCMTQDSISFREAQVKNFRNSKASLAHECHFATQEPSFGSHSRYFAIAKVILTRVPLYDIHFAAKRIASSENGSPVIFSDHPFRPNFGNPKWREQEDLRKEPVPDPVSEPSQPRAVPPPVKPAPPKPPARRYLTSSEPIDLTEQSPSRCGSISVSLLVSSLPSPAISEPQAKPQEPQPPLPEPQIPAEIAPEEVIRRPMLTQPPIEGNLDCRARPFHSELCFDIATFRVRPELTVIQL